MKQVLFVVFCLMSFLPVVAADYPIRAAKMTDVKVTGGFWFDRLATNRLVTLKADFAKCNETPRIANFTNCAARVKGGKFGGIFFDDSDVYKVMEGAAYIYAETKDPELEKYMDWLIGEMAKAQEPDGYLYTARTLGGNESIDGTARWENLSWSHEFYNQGHMYEAAVAWYEATGKTNFLAIARKSADLIDRTFGWEPGKLKLTSGHQEMELALCKLYRVTGEERYLKLAKFLLDVRGRKDVRAIWGPRAQDHLPVLQQDEAVGHAVRACYMYSGMADVAALTGDHSYMAAIDRLWESVVGHKLHLNGGVGAAQWVRHSKWGESLEAFGEDYYLPNENAYLETCAAIALALWNQRMFCWKGEAKYVDVLERTIYNGFVSGISLSGDEFFYPNPLANKTGVGNAKDKPYVRSKWFGCSCCPVNDVRFIPQIPSFAYATDGKGTLYWNLFMEGEATVGGVKVVCKTEYPWNGKAMLTLNHLTAQPLNRLTLKIRIPGWAKGQPVPSDLYTQTKPSSAMEISVAVNGRAVNGVPGKDGYLTVEREWKGGDVVEVDLPMPVKRIRAHAKVEADKGRLAVERGPIVYCAEGCDNGGKAFDAVLPADATFTDDTIVIGDKTFPALKASNGLKLIPYCLWGNREPGNEMQVWFKER